MAQISYYNELLKPIPSGTTTVADWLSDVTLGRWKAQCEAVAAEEDKDTRTELKKKLGGITGSGTFSTRSAAGLIAHSQYLVADFDGLGDAEAVDEYKAKLAADPYTYAVGKSVSGRGLWAFVAIDGNRHGDAFDALKEYYFSTYGLIIDKACRDVPRFRFNAYDPETFVNPQPQTYKKYLTKAAKASYSVPAFITTESDADQLIQRIADSGIDLTQGDYGRYLRIGFAIADQWADSGLDRYQTLCSRNEKYEPAKCEKQYKYCLTANRRGNNHGVGIGTLYHFAKQAGIETASEKTKYIATVAQQTKAAGRGMDSAARELAVRGISGDEVDEILKQVNESAAGLRAGDELTLFGRLEIFLQTQHPTLRKNAITRKVELKGRALEDRDINSIYIAATKSVDEKIAKGHVEALVYSNFTPDYNPLLDFFINNQYKQETGHIKALAASVTTTTGTKHPERLDSGYLEFFLTKWLVGMIASAHGQHSPLLLAFTGCQNSGKSEFFRRLLPPLLQQYYAESKLDAGKDDEILMTQKLVVCDDEMGGKSKRDETRLKELTSKAVFTLREPYGRANVDLQRLAVLCGTSNQSDLLNDPTGNRRVIPVDVVSIDHAKYNAVDKTALVMEAYHRFQAGESWHLSSADIQRLAAQTSSFEGVVTERELIQANFNLPEAGGFTDYMTTTEILNWLQKDIKLNLSIRVLGSQLQALGFKRSSIRSGSHVTSKYAVVKTGGFTHNVGSSGGEVSPPVWGDPGTPGAAEIANLPF